MARTCTVCAHHDVDEINRQLVIGDSTAGIARKYALSWDAVDRHKKNHLPVALEASPSVQDVARADSLLGELKLVREKAMALLDKAEKAADTRAYGPPAAYLRELREIFKLVAELEGRLASREQINIVINNPAWIELRTLIVEAVEPYPEARAAIIHSISRYNEGIHK